jgi:hypothetical protein
MPPPLERKLVGARLRSEPLPHIIFHFATDTFDAFKCELTGDVSQLVDVLLIIAERAIPRVVRARLIDPGLRDDLSRPLFGFSAVRGCSLSSPTIH